LSPDILAEPILVGRERELEELIGFLDSAIEGKGTTVSVDGFKGDINVKYTQVNLFPTNSYQNGSFTINGALRVERLRQFRWTNTCALLRSTYKRNYSIVDGFRLDALRN
jgi:hypothetical protein